MSQLLMEKIAALSEYEIKKEAFEAIDEFQEKMAYSEEQEDQMRKEHESKMKRKAINKLLPKGTLIGGIGGGVAGSLIGEATKKNWKQALSIGTAVGAGIGTVGGILSGKYRGKKVSDQDYSYRKGQLQKYKAMQGIDASDFEDLKYPDSPWTRTGKTLSRARKTPSRFRLIIV